MNKVQKLRVAAEVAIAIRNTDEAKLRAKRIKVVDKDGRLVREVTRAELLEKQLIAQGIEIDTKVTPGVRPKAMRCECGMPFVVRKKGVVQEHCAPCRRAIKKATERAEARRRYYQDLERSRRYARELAAKDRERRRDGRPPLTREQQNEVLARGRSTAIAKRAARTECKRGHAYVVHGIARKGGGRDCRECMKIARNRYRAKQRQRSE